MGWRYNKSINLGGGFRINLSKSGVGYSWGFPGYRITKTATGNRRKTYSIPGSGISYTETFKNRSNNNLNEVNYDNNTKLITGETTYFQNENIKQFNKEDDVLNQISILRRINFLSNILLFTILLAYIPIFIFTFIGGIVLKVLIKTKWSIDLTYEFDEFSLNKYDGLNRFLNEISKNNRIWQINSSVKVYNTKYNSGAGNNITRNLATINNKMPWYIKKNIEVFSLNLNNEKIFFTPDRMIIFRGLTEVGGRSYRDMVAGFSYTNFVETEGVPRDANIIRYTWRYVNKSGGPDKRFSNNRQIPVCNYGEITLQTKDGINIVLNCSNSQLMISIQESFKEFQKFHNAEIISEKQDAKEYINSHIAEENFNDPLYDKVLEFVLSQGEASASLLQRQFRISYNRAVNLINRLEERGIIGCDNGANPREVLVEKQPA